MAAPARWRAPASTSRKSFALIEILKFVLSVLGLTWANIRDKLVARDQRDRGEGARDRVRHRRDAGQEGPAAAWEELLKTLSNLKSLVVDAAIDFVKEAM